VSASEQVIYRGIDSPRSCRNALSCREVRTRCRNAAHGAVVNVLWNMQRKAALTSRHMSSYLYIVRNRVRAERLLREMSQAEFAAALDVSRQTVISIENGRYLPSLPLAFRIARLLDMPIEKIFELDPEERIT
jgi:putative transcriptional regulator